MYEIYWGELFEWDPKKKRALQKIQAAMQPALLLGLLTNQINTGMFLSSLVENSMGGLEKVQ